MRAARFLLIAGLAVPIHPQTVFEGALLITGDGSTIENSAFSVENAQFVQVGRRGQVRVPPGTARVDLTGRTVMPAKVDLHGHIGFQHDTDR